MIMRPRQILNNKPAMLLSANFIKEYIELSTIDFFNHRISNFIEAINIECYTLSKDLKLIYC